MQQYYDVDTRGVVLTVFHPPEGVSFDIEHYGHIALDDPQPVRDLFAGDRASFEATQERGADARFERLEAGGFRVTIDGRREITVDLTPAQFETLVESLGAGDASVGYPVEWVDRDGVRDRAQ